MVRLYLVHIAIVICQISKSTESSFYAQYVCKGMASQSDMSDVAPKGHNYISTWVRHCPATIICLFYGFFVSGAILDSQQTKNQSLAPFCCRLSNVFDYISSIVIITLFGRTLKRDMVQPWQTTQYLKIYQVKISWPINWVHLGLFNSAVIFSPQLSWSMYR